MAGDAAALPAADALRMVTINSARALGLEQDIGSLEIGKSADIVAIDLSYPETEPVYQPLSQLIYATSRRQVSDVWVAGRRLLAEHQLTTLDLAAILARARHWQHNIAAAHRA